MATTNFFISYTAADNAWAQWIAWQLEAAGYTTSIQAWDSRPGNDFVAWMDQQLREAERILVVLSPAYEQATSFTVPEWTAAIGRDPSGRLGVLLPVRVADFTPGGLFRTRGWIDLAGRDRQAAKDALLVGIRQERMKPAQEPPFPGDQPPEPAFPGSTKPQWVRNLPMERNPVFTGRRGLLTRLHQALTRPGDQQARVVLTGMGGVGKSALAVEYAYRHREEHRVVWWLRAERPETLVADLAALAGPLGLPEAGAREQQVVLDAVDRWLNSHDGWLLVVDNAEPTKQTTDLLPEGPGRLLVTSRDVAWRRQATALLPVEVLGRAESVRLLGRRSGDGDRAAAGRLAEVLGDLPLALEQAGAYCEAEQLPLAGYLELLHRNAAELFAEGQPVDYTHTVATNWTLGVDKAAGRSPQAPDLLRLFAYLGPEELPWDLLAPALAEQPELPGALAGIAVGGLDRALGALARFSLVRRAGDEVVAHRLVQQVVRDQLDEQTATGWAGAAVRLVLAAWPTESWLPAAWPRCAQLLPHALAAAEHARKLPVAPQQTGALLNHAGVYLAGRVDLVGARASFERALAVQEAADGAHQLEVARTLSNLGLVLRQVGKLSEAYIHLQRALAIFEAAHGPNHPEVARALTNLGLVVYDLGQPSQARAQLERALAINVAAYGPHDPHVASTLHNLGVVLPRLGQLPEARDRLEQARTIFAEAYSPQHPEVARTLDNLGLVHRELGQLSEARACHEQSLELFEAAYRRDHFEVARTLGNLGLVLGELGELAQARAQLERALAIFEAVVGPDHAQVANTLHRLSGVLGQLGEPAQAEACEQRAQAILHKLGRLGLGEWSHAPRWSPPWAT
jgi:tetratricopeptide (TPR) repeat protein